MSIQNDFKKLSKWLIITLSALLGAICFTFLWTTENANAKSLPVFTIIDIDLSIAGTPGKNCDCSHDRYNCSDFSTQEDAQACYWACGALSLGDIHRLDLDDNRVACDSPIVNSNCNCDGDFYGCLDFESQEAAQACYWSCGGQGKGDIHELDPDADLQACEELPIISPLNVFLAAPAASSEPTHTIAPGSEPNSSCDCSADFYNCVDFTTQEDAQACYWSCGHQGKGDIHGLDLDINMVACEGIPTAEDVEHLNQHLNQLPHQKAQSQMSTVTARPISIIVLILHLRKMLKPVTGPVAHKVQAISMVWI